MTAAVSAEVARLRQPDGPESYRTRTEIAEFMRVSERTIDRWSREGLPYETWGLRTKKFRASDVVRWARGRAA